MLQHRPITDWLPITQKEVEKRGWEELDVILISGDAYVDHPGFWSGRDRADHRGCRLPGRNCAPTQLAGRFA